jgi:hypothetical protein
MPLTGVWVNEHKSVMVISEQQDGALTGTFRSLVGRDTGKRALCGRVSSDEAGKQLLGFTVCFEITNPQQGAGHHSLCAWAGWVRGEEITAHWLLATSFLELKDEWSTMRTGQDRFVRVFAGANLDYLNFDERTLSGLLADGDK